MNDEVYKPVGYTMGDVECVDGLVSMLTEEEFRGACKAQAVQYIWREAHKGGDQDLSKAIWWLRFAVGDDPRVERESKPVETTKPDFQLSYPPVFMKWATRNTSDFTEEQAALSEKIAREVLWGDGHTLTGRSREQIRDLISGVFSVNEINLNRNGSYSNLFREWLRADHHTAQTYNDYGIYIKYARERLMLYSLEEPDNDIRDIMFRIVYNKERS